jgi:uncharacterized membrane protein
VISLAELHGLIVHLPLLAVPTFAVLAALAWRGKGGDLVVRVEPWAFAASVVGSVVAVASGLTVLGEARTTLRGAAQSWIYAHVALGLALAFFFVAAGWLRRRRRRRAQPDLPFGALTALGLVTLALAGGGGYVGGRMVFKDGVGVSQGGQFRQTAQGAEVLAAALARRLPPVEIGKQAFQDGLRCASCHGMRAQGGVGPGLGGGFEPARFRDVHSAGLFPPAVVTDRMVNAIDAWLRTLPKSRNRGE